MEIHTIGIDLGKTLFHLVAVDSSGTVVVRKRCSRAQLLTYTANIRVHRIGMEACSGSHFLGRALREQGHDVRLLPAQYVKPYVKTNKSDYIDAEAIAEAVERPNMRFVPIKTEEQLDLQTVHRIRERWVMRRTAVVNQMRGLLLERGLTVAKGRKHLEEAMGLRSEEGATWPPGLEWCRENTPPAADRNCWASANAGTRICEDCSYRERAPSCNVATAKPIH